MTSLRFPIAFWYLPGELHDPEAASRQLTVAPTLLSNENFIYFAWLKASKKASVTTTETKWKKQQLYTNSFSDSIYLQNIVSALVDHRADGFVKVGKYW